MTLTTAIGTSLALGFAMAVLMAGAWLIRRRTANSGWIDVTWTFGIGLVGAVSALFAVDGAELYGRQLLVAGLVVIWSLRLGSHITQRTRASSDDPRYAALAREWGNDAPRRMFLFVQIQALVSMPLLATISVAAHRPGVGLSFQDMLGASVLAIAIAGEAVADSQLRAFRTDSSNQGRVCDVGLWRLSRHPNYFFQWLGWLAYPLIAIDPAGVYPWGWLTLAGPICMYWLLVHVSGIPPLEQHMLRSRGAAFRAYQDRTSAFFPRPQGRKARAAHAPDRNCKALDCDVTTIVERPKAKHP
jgi:steroid 5-alpha reductase family enzyme